MYFISDIFWIVNLYLENDDFIFIIKIEIKVKEKSALKKEGKSEILGFDVQC